MRLHSMIFIDSTFGGQNNQEDYVQKLTPLTYLPLQLSRIISFASYQEKSSLCCKLEQYISIPIIVGTHLILLYLQFLLQILTFTTLNHVRKCKTKRITHKVLGDSRHCLDLLEAVTFLFLEVATSTFGLLESFSGIIYL